NYVIMVTMYFTVSVVNNYALNFNISMPLHMIFRSGSLIANIILGIIILKKRYTITKYVSIALVSLGIFICTIMTAKQVASEPSSNEGEGIAMLTFALLMSARMGIFQETLYKKYGKHSKEALFYNHCLPLPGFLLLASDIYNHSVLFSQSGPRFLGLIGRTAHNHMLAEARALYPEGQPHSGPYRLTKSDADNFWKRSFGDRSLVHWSCFQEQLCRVHFFQNGLESVALKSTIDLTCNDHVSAFEFDIFTRLFQGHAEREASVQGRDQQASCISEREQACPEKEGQETDPEREGQQTDPEREGQQTDPEREGQQTDPEREGQQTDPEREGQQTDPEREGQQTDPEREGQQTDPEREGQQTDPEREGQQTDPAKESNQAVAATPSRNESDLDYWSPDSPRILWDRGWEDLFEDLEDWGWCFVCGEFGHKEVCYPLLSQEEDEPFAQKQKRRRGGCSQRQAKEPIPSPVTARDVLPPPDCPEPPSLTVSPQPPGRELTAADRELAVVARQLCLTTAASERVSRTTGERVSRATRVLHAT
ncbi:UNVERIFIED_CONTAM: hypothetical protein FKN15_030442, partial [Acipenser sinensis]